MRWILACEAAADTSLPSSGEIWTYMRTRLLPWGMIMQEPRGERMVHFIYGC